MEESEDALISRCQAGDKDAFGVLVKRYAGRAIGAAQALLGDHADALDVSQEAFVRAWRNIRRFDGRAKFYTWCSTILRNACISHLRSRSRRKAQALVGDHAAPTEESDPSILAERNERTERIWRAVAALPVKHRDVIVMHHFQQMSYKQMAEALEIPFGTVTSRLHNARKALQDTLAGENTCTAKTATKN